MPPPSFDTRPGPSNEISTITFHGGTGGTSGQPVGSYPATQPLNIRLAAICAVTRLPFRPTISMMQPPMSEKASPSRPIPGEFLVSVFIVLNGLRRRNLLDRQTVAQVLLVDVAERVRKLFLD